MNELQAAVVSIAQSQVGVRETTPNRGVEVDRYIRSVGLDPGAGAYAWCGAFAHWVYETAALRLGIPNPLPKHAGVQTLWKDVRCAQIRFSPGSLVLASDPDRIIGGVFCAEHNRGRGHCGIVTGPVVAGLFTTIEGNTSIGGSREGDGVYARVDRSLSMVGLLGFVLPVYLPAAPLVA